MPLTYYRLLSSCTDDQLRTICERRKLPLPARWRKTALPALVFLVFAAGLAGFPAFPLFAGFFVFLFAATHVLVLWPDLAPRIEKIQRRRPPRA